MNWYDNRFDETFTYIKVSPVDWTEQGTYDFITTGSIEMAEDNKYKVTGSFSFEGLEKPDPNYYMRVYYTFKAFNDDAEKYEEHTELLGTFIVTYSAMQYKDGIDGLRYSGTINAYSILKILDDKKYGEPFVIKMNTNPIYKAYQLMDEFGIRVDYVPSSSIVKKDYTFSSDSSYLDIINWLCDYAKYREVYVNTEGVACMSPKLKPALDPEPIVFKNDRQSIMYPEVDEENDYMERPNVVKILYNTDQAWGIGTARNLSGSRMSLDATGGREKTLVEEVSDLTLKDSDGRFNEDNIIEQLQKKAVEKLTEESNEEEHVTFSHAYIPMALGKAVKIEYSDMSWVGNAENISINLAPAIETQTKITNTKETSLIIDKTAKIVIRNGG